MSISSSIFQKPCPACASSVSVSAARCGCGHIFETATNSLSPLEAALRDEELYEGYLAARADQARQAAHSAEQALAEDAGNPELTSAAMLAIEVARSIDSDLAEQRNKIAAMRNALHERKPAAPVAAPKKASTARPVVKPSTPVRRAATTPAPVASANSPSVTAPAKPVSTPVWQATTTQKAAGVLSALKNAKAREAIARAQQASAAAEAKKASAAASTHGAAPPSAFRKEQASRAEKIMEARKTVDGKECPNCTSSVPINTTRCRCGFAFVSDSTELPSLTLCTGDFTALRDSLKLNLR